MYRLSSMYVIYKFPLSMALLYIIYIILGLGILFDDPMYIVFKDIFIFRCVFGLTKKVCDFAQGFKNNIIRP